MTLTKELAKFRALLHLVAPKCMMGTHTHSFEVSLRLFDVRADSLSQRPIWTLLLILCLHLSPIHIHTANVFLFFCFFFFFFLSHRDLFVCPELSSYLFPQVVGEENWLWRLSSCTSGDGGREGAHTRLQKPSFTPSIPVKLHQVEHKIPPGQNSSNMHWSKECPQQLWPSHCLFLH